MVTGCRCISLTRLDEAEREEGSGLSDVDQNRTVLPQDAAVPQPEKPDAMATGPAAIDAFSENKSLFICLVKQSRREQVLISGTERRP